jgi:hypothetical protein
MARPTPIPTRPDLRGHKIPSLISAIEGRLAVSISHDGAQRLAALRQQAAEFKGSLIAASDAGDADLAASIARVIAAL